MAKRPYTMKEMKQIVEYLVEHKAYHEVRGRKMWVDMANSRRIDRTWQSLKETFLKRILPDIYNSYFNLTPEQINNFIREKEISSLRSAKLELQSTSEESNSRSSDKHQAKGPSDKNENKKSGEAQCSKIQSRTRSSTDTLVLEECEVNEEAPKEPESGTKTRKSLRDLITYSEPLTPMLQEVIDDFTSDEDPPLRIVEEPEPPDDSEANKKSNAPFRFDAEQAKPTTMCVIHEEGMKIIESSCKIKSLKLKKTQKGTWENKELIEVAVQDNNANNNDECEIILSVKEDKSKSVDKSKNNTSVDTQLPNNQEALAHNSTSTRVSTESSNSDQLETRKKKKEKRKRSRSRSQSKVDHKKKKKSKHHDMSSKPADQDQVKDTQTFDSHPHAAEIQEQMAVDEIQNTQTTELREQLPIEEVNNRQTAELQKESAVEVVNNSQAAELQQKPAVDKVHTHEPNNSSQSILEGNKVDDDITITPNQVVDKSKNEGTSQEAGPSGINDIINPCTKSPTFHAELSTTSPPANLDFKETKTRNGNCSQNKNDDNFRNECATKNDTTAVDKNTKERVMNNTNTVKISENNKMHKKKLENEVLLLQSHSESDSDDFEPMDEKKSIINSRNRALANVFGFASGALPQKKLKGRSRSKNVCLKPRCPPRHQIIKKRSESSDSSYTTISEKDLERAGPSTSHRTDPHLVAGASLYQALAAEEEPAHYNVVSKPKPRIQDDSLFWKAKYLEESKKLAEEKIRADELARKLKMSHIQEQRRQHVIDVDETCSPFLQTNLVLSSTTIEKQGKSVMKSPAKPASTSSVAEKDASADTVKIKISKNNDIELEGKWTEVNPILEKIYTLFHINNAQESKKTVEETATENKKPSLKNEEAQTSIYNLVSKQSQENSNKKQDEMKPQRKSRRSATETAIPKAEQKIVGKDSKRKASSDIESISSGNSTPSVIPMKADMETHKKVDKIENEIFKTIEEIDKSDQGIVENGNADTEPNVTKRKRGRPLKSTSLSSVTSLEGAAKTQNGAKKPRRSSRAEETGSDVSARRAHKPPTRYTSDTGANVASKTKRRRQMINIPVRNPAEDSVIVSDDDEDSVRYMLPPASTDANRPPATAAPYPDTTRDSQGYQDSDNSNSPKINLRKKRKLGTVGLLNKKGKIGKVRRKSSPYLADDSCSTNEALSQHSKANTATLNSEVYRSESFQLLMPKSKAVAQMDKIEESPAQSDADNRRSFENLTPLTVQVNNEFYIPSQEHRNDIHHSSDINSSNSVSLPLSPELSVVENLSISRELLGRSFKHIPTINEIQDHDVSRTLNTNCDKYLISEVDVSMPLMQQDCEVRTRQNKTSLDKPPPVIPEANTDNQTLSDTLDKKLRDLLLESAKKIEDRNMEPIRMEVDKTSTALKTTKNKRRSSTPRKRTSLPKSKTPNVDPVLEEHTESCSFGGRKSCPPAINIVPCEVESSDKVPDEITESPAISKGKGNLNKGNKRGRKKDVIKVKIQRPRGKSHSTDRTSTKRVSVCTDSGINDTSSNISGCKCCDESDELIHNHSDTCLNIEECVGDSVEIIENPEASVISLSSNSFPCESQSLEKKRSSGEFLTPDSFCTNAQNATVLNSAKPLEEDGDTATVYHTPPENGSFDSLMTEDLSDEGPIVTQKGTKWYLLAEDETNFQDARSQSSCSTIGANLKQIFPLTCAIPDLSTITEISKENDSKPAPTESEMSTFSQSVFEFNF